MIGGRKNRQKAVPLQEMSTYQESQGAASPKRASARLPVSEDPAARTLAQPSVQLGSRGRSLLWLLVALLIAMTVGRFWHLDADVPQWFASSDVGLHVDEGYKTLDSRNLIQEGSRHWNEFDDYPGWSPKSPLTQALFHLAMRIGGADVVSARIVSVATFMLLLLAYVAAFSRTYPALALIVGALVLVSDPLLFHFSRVGLFEQFIALFTGLALISVHLLRGRSTTAVVLVLTGFAAFSTLAIKPSAFLYLVPAIVGLGAYQVLASARRWAIIASCSVAVIPLSLLAFLTRDYWLPHFELVALTAVPRRLLIAPIPVLDPLVALATAGVILHGLSNSPLRYLGDRYRLALIATFAGVPVILACLTHAPPRYFPAMMVCAPLLIADYVANRVWSWETEGRINMVQWIPIAAIVVVAAWLFLRGIDYAILSRLPFSIGDSPGVTAKATLRFFPPVAILSIAVFALVRNRVLRTPGPRICITLAIIIAVGMGAFEQFKTHSMPTYFANEIRAGIESRVPGKASVAGDWAPYLTLGTSRRALYMNNRFNRAERVLETRPNFFLYAGTGNDRESLSILMNDSKIQVDDGVRVGSLLGRSIVLHEITYLVPDSSEIPGSNMMDDPDDESVHRRSGPGEPDDDQAGADLGAPHAV